MIFIDDEQIASRNRILPSYYINPDSIYNKSILLRSVVIAYLYYRDTIEDYVNVLCKVPQDIELIVITSDIFVEKYVKENISLKRTCKVVLTKNRGRDVAALLVTAKRYIQSFEYVCFLHDKKEKIKCQKKDIESWVRDLWVNAIGSKEYIVNLLSLFEREKKLGLLFPEVSGGDYVDINMSRGWGNNYNNALKLKDQLGLVNGITNDTPPVSYGMMFWYRKDAMHKLMDYPWKYTDFPEEPLADDGTISHAIERILPFVCVDAGYEYAYIMSECFAEKYIGKLKRHTFEMNGIINKYLGLRYMKDITEMKEKAELLDNFCSNKTSIYIYGAGERGREIFVFIKTVLGRNVSGFIDANKHGSKVFGIPVLGLDEISRDKETGIIIAVGLRLYDEVNRLLIENGYTAVIRA